MKLIVGIVFILLLSSVNAGERGEEFIKYYDWKKCDDASQVFSGSDCDREPPMSTKGCNLIDGNDMYMRDIVIPGGPRISYAILKWDGESFFVKEVIE